MQTVTMRRTHDVGPRGVNGPVDHEGRGIEHPHRTPVDDLAGVVHLDQVGGFDLREGDAEGVDPEGGGVDGVAEGDVACDALGVLVM